MEKFIQPEERFMRRALEIAERGAGKVSPNPMVGAVLVRDGSIIGEGWHAYCGGLHAERAALLDCRERGENPAGADLYVTLEPCCHFGRQPPCTDAILEAGIARVFTGCQDPNPKVAGKGIRILREHGISVAEGVLEEECRTQNEVFLHYIRTGLPFTVLKYAMTLDGKTACFTGEARWVTGETARAHVHGLRNRYAGILVGVNTVLRDDPLLTCRMTGGRNPVRVILDTHLRTPLQAKAVTGAGREARTVIATAERDPVRQAPYREAGCELLEILEGPGGGIHISELLTRLGAGGLGLDSLLAEGGGAVAWSLLRSGAVNKVLAYVAPKLFGGGGAKTPVGGQGVPFPGEAFRLKGLQVERLGEDLLMTAYPAEPLGEEADHQAEDRMEA